MSQPAELDRIIIPLGVAPGGEADLSLFEDIWKDKRKVIAVAVLVVAVAAFIRFYHIEWSFSNNGIDEGIMIERAYLLSTGFDLYKEIACDQAPLAFLIGSAFQGDVVVLRSLSASLSVLAILACMYVARRIRGDTAMLITGALLALDFAFLRESRLFSLDGLSAYFLAFAILAMTGYVKGGNRVALASAGILIGLSASIKLFGGLALAGVVVYMLLEWRRGRAKGTSLATDLSIVIVSAAAPLAILMLALGPSDMIEGMILDQGGRGFDAFLKLSILAYFGVCPAYALPLLRARAMWGKGPAEVRFLLVLSLVVLVAMVVQPLTFLHHMVILSPALSILAGVLIGQALESRKGISKLAKERNSSKSELSFLGAFSAVLIVTLLIGAGFASYGLWRQEEPPANQFANLLQSATDEDEYVISGDPLIAALACRMMPPGLVNLAYRVGDEVTEDEVEGAIVEYDVQAVIVCYKLVDMPGLVQFLEENGFTEVHRLAESDLPGVLDLFQEGHWTITLYLKE